ncbi:hypothetical protein PYW07_008487 [Mythimna separata]|uniref:Mitochondrial fission process protein 1 n=1 Tax=Mythimna separata TaxID=271217 RepID=A0AAD7YDV6_MYTSE|nr:hypothetical protein PYW07_008487 [Mythimna separata]
MNEPVDIWRDTWVRYLGYANEVGESFRPMVSRNVVRGSYAVAFGYTVADTVDKSYKAHKRGDGPHAVVIEAGDALIWQTLASVAIPGYVINRLCYFSTEILRKYSKVPRKTRNWVAVGVGLASIPFIVRPIDNTTTWFMDNTYRKLVSYIK